MYHENIIGWPRQIKLLLGQSHVDDKILEAIAEDRKLPHVQIRREAIRIFDNVAIVYYTVKRTWINKNGELRGCGMWTKVTHTWMHVGYIWKIIGGMAALLLYMKIDDFHKSNKQFINKKIYT